MSDIYASLRERLDAMSVGFPATASGLEIKILKRLFSPQDALLFLALSPVPETSTQIANKTGRNQEELNMQLESMAQKGLLFRRKKKNELKYGIVPYMVGIFEFQLKTMDRELAEDFEEYFESAIGKKLHGYKTPLMRTIPLNIDFATQLPVAPYDDVMRIIDSHEIITIADCVCRATKQKIDQGCHLPMETCFQFGSMAEYYIDNNMGRRISREEAVVIVKQCDEAGLVLQPFNDQKAGSMCACCKCCCAVLRSVQMQAIPAKAVRSNYQSIVAVEECTGCKICEKRCPMEAVRVKDKKALVDLNRCIGCGLCTTTCKTKAIMLTRKSEPEIYVPPINGIETQKRILQERGKL